MENRVYIRRFHENDAEALLQLEKDNQNFSREFNSRKAEHFYTLEHQKTLILNAQSDWESDLNYFWGVYLKANDELIGTLNIFQVVRGPIQGAWLGYAMSEAHNGFGYTTEAAGLAMVYAFDALKLHRIEAGAMPANIGSVRVLEKLGFTKEGLSFKNVKINDHWEDHYLFAKLNPKDEI